MGDLRLIAKFLGLMLVLCLLQIDALTTNRGKEGGHVVQGVVTQVTIIIHLAILLIKDLMEKRNNPKSIYLVKTTQHLSDPER